MREPRRFQFRQRLDVAQHAQVDPVDDGIRPQAPVGIRPEPVFIPGRPHQPRTPACSPLQQELPLARYEMAVEVRRMDVQVTHRHAINERGSRAVKSRVDTNPSANGVPTNNAQP